MGIFFLSRGKTMYEVYLSLKDTCTGIARDYAKKNDTRMAKFWANASKGYEIKMLNMTLDQAKEGLMTIDF